MAPIDREEREARRQQRKRGAGTTAAITDFNFNFNFGPPAAKQSSLPPQRNQRTPTPRQQTPRARNSSAKRHRSASIPRSSGVRRQSTPRTFVTPQLGKRKRGSKDAQELDQDDGQPDELSPDQNNETNSVERERRVVATVSPVREEVDEEPEEPDELAMDIQAAFGLEDTPAPSNISREKSQSVTRLSSRRSKSTEAPPETPTVLSSRRSRKSSSRSLVPATPSIASVIEEEDELTPAPASVTPRVIGEESITEVAIQEEDEMDELSSPAHVTNVEFDPTPEVPKTRRSSSPRTRQPNKSISPVPTKRGTPKRVVAEEENERRSIPASAKGRPKKTRLSAQESADAEDSLDELSPEPIETREPSAKRKNGKHSAQSRNEPTPVLSPEVESAPEDAEHEPEEEEVQEPEDEPTIHILPIPRDNPVKRIKNQAPRAKRKPSGPRQAISVMRIKGSTVKGVTVADTTRTILEENIDQQVQRMASKMQTADDSSRRKKLRGHINLALAFKESLVEKLMDLQDANDTLSAGFKKRKLLKKDNLERRREILTIQNSRHEVALEMDDERAVYDAAKARAEAKSKLSANMFDIQAAVQSGRERARREGRENEGAERPLSMLLDTIGRQVGSVGGGLLARMQHFNEGLERAAGWIEGRA